jgi:hypothetical protein
MVTIAILGVIVMFLGLALSAYALYLTENKGRGEPRFR